MLASIFLPILAKSEKGKVEELKEEMERTAMIRTIDAEINLVREIMTDENRSVAVSIISNYNQLRSRLKTISDEDATKLKQLETETRMKALDAEVIYLEKLKKEGKVNLEATYLLEEHIQRMRLGVTNGLLYRSLFIWSIIKRSLYQIFAPKKKMRYKNRKLEINIIIQLKVDMAKVAIQYLKNHMTPENEDSYLLIIGEYNDMILKFKLAKKRYRHYKLHSGQKRTKRQGFSS